MVLSAALSFILLWTSHKPLRALVTPSVKLGVILYDFRDAFQL